MSVQTLGNRRGSAYDVKPAPGSALTHIPGDDGWPIVGHTLPVTPGAHKVSFEIGADKYGFRVTVKAGEVTTLTKDFVQ